MTTTRLLFSILAVAFQLLVMGCGGGSDSGGVNEPGPNVAGQYSGEIRSFRVGDRFQARRAKLTITIQPGGNVVIVWVASDRTLRLTGRMTSSTNFFVSVDVPEEFFPGSGQFCSFGIDVNGRYDRAVLFGNANFEISCDSANGKGSQDFFAQRASN